MSKPESSEPSSKILVTGVGPIPPDRPPKLHAPGLRLWGFADAIEAAGYEVILCEAMFAGQEGLIEEHQDGRGFKQFEDRRIKQYILPLDPEAAARRLSEIAAEHRPAASVSLTDVMNCAVALAKLPCPTWFDYYGHPMAERQMLAQIHGSDDGLMAQWMMILPSLLGGDRFSVCCPMEKGAILGELGACGRLNQNTGGQDIIEIVRPWFVPTDLEGKPGAIRGKLCDEDSVVVLAAGGFNTWFDEATLFRGMEFAMKRSERVHFVSVGGAIKGHNERTFDEFMRRVEGSRFRDRYHFVGWVPHETVPDYYRESDMAVNVDLFSYEGLVGTRTRILEWAAAGIPILTTCLSEITEDLAEKNLIYDFGYGEWGTLGEHILAIGAERTSARAVARATRDYVENNYSLTGVTEPLIQWLESPEPARDLPAPASRPDTAGMLAPGNSMAQFWIENYRKRDALTGGPARSLGQRIQRKLKGLFSS